MAPLKADKLLGILGLALLVGAASVASLDYEATSSTRRGQSAEGLFHGITTILGLEEPTDGGMVWLARLMVLAGLAVLGLVIWRRAQRRRTVLPPALPAG